MAYTLYLDYREYEAILSHARAGLPNEACGLVAGHIEGNVKVVEKVYLLTNVDNSPEHFTIDPAEHLGAVKDARARGLAMLGNWHSHPETPARQSEEDKRLAYDHGASYLILSLAGEKPVLKSFHFDGETSTEEALVVGP